MIRCTFHLNGGRLSNLSCPGIGFFPAYSGNAGPHRNNPGSAVLQDIGPLPPGKYHIVNRPKGGAMGILRDQINSLLSGSDRTLWLGLFRDDGTIDDYTFIEYVRRGNFRLHPAGYQGVSNGCITLPDHFHYAILRKALLRAPTTPLSGGLISYGTIQVY